MVVPHEEPKTPRKPKTSTRRSKPRDRSLPVPVPTSPAALTIINPDAAGIDVHSNMHMVCVPADRDANPVRQFGANTVDLHEIVAWLKKCRIKTIALESTGVYWIALFELLESEGFEVNLVEPGQLSRCGARPKTDVLDAQWIQRLHSYGLLRVSFRPPDSVLALRAFWRLRQRQVRYAASHVEHMQKALEQMNMKLTEVVSDITGLTGMLIIGAILEGERDPNQLARLRHPQCHHSREQIALALDGTWRSEHLFELRQAYELYQFHHRQITECDQQIQVELAKFPNRAGEKPHTVKPRNRGRKSNDVRFEAAGPLLRALGVDLTLIEGIDVGTALVILAEIGVDVSRFPTEKHFASWLRLCPPQNESNKTNRRHRNRKGTSRVTIALRMAAQSVGRTMTPLGLFYRRIRSRIGGLGAVKATAHKLACLVYRMLKYGQEYVTQSMEEYEAKVKANTFRALERKAAAMGFQLSPLPNR
ncbi:MAG: IS110 family transposase [Planctomycetaceae bacterium]|nr:IS110 family transposase [Planctomycetaceae bacterium]